MNQRVIKLGNGYADFFELMELAVTNQSRLIACFQLETLDDRISLGIVLKPAKHPSTFMPIYLCLEGFKRDSKRVHQFQEFANQEGHTLHTVAVKPLNLFYDDEQYARYLIGLLRSQRVLPPMG
ncbi:MULTISPECIES: DUF7147 family protein [Shouchella]|uniref:DUF7147 domain-containing protein n=3 Tax=Bacillaceae TaxID=186817 RepID=A0A060LYU2_9BACI|nr:MULTISPECIES: hypothetical protein [Bacillaceae]RQW20776.1 methylthioribose kinase [Bacillus sp. C1-1]AIC94940.1 hypothetical protein BleG1_2362 [Shouchella lehensis G1]KQL58135.1 hypothetical protein AN965_05005 [Alkalicoccobacillus plakortidis]MBG9784211.1 hypothetical protein [Shouchella lehensis]TES50800.1 methylthioribose kinase [Shouchella lehensis]